MLRNFFGILAVSFLVSTFTLATMAHDNGQFPQAKIEEMVVNDQGITLVTGIFSGEMYIESHTLKANGISDIFYMIMDEDGALATGRLGGAHVDRIYGARLDSYGDFRIDYARTELDGNGNEVLIPSQLIISEDGEIVRHTSLPKGLRQMNLGLSHSVLDPEDDDDYNDPVGKAAAQTILDVVPVRDIDLPLEHSVLDPEDDDDYNDPVGLTSTEEKPATVNSVLDPEDDDDYNDPVGFTSTEEKPAPVNSVLDPEDDDDYNDPVGFTSTEEKPAPVNSVLDPEDDDDYNDPVGFTSTKEKPAPLNSVLDPEDDDDYNDPVGLTQTAPAPEGTVLDPDDDDDYNDPIG